MSPFVLVGTHSSGRVSSLMFPISPPVIRSSHRGSARGAHVSSAGAAPGPPPLPPRLLGVNPGECSPPQHLLLPVLNQWSSSSLLHLLHLRLFCLLRHLLPHRSGLECGDRKWSAGVGADGPGRAPSPHFSMLDSESDGEEREGAGEG